MENKEWWASLALVMVALLCARLLSSWGHSGRTQIRTTKRHAFSRKPHGG